MNIFTLVGAARARFIVALPIFPDPSTPWLPFTATS
jgi:hypothetical protein